MIGSVRGESGQVNFTRLSWDGDLHTYNVHVERVKFQIDLLYKENVDFRLVQVTGLLFIFPTHS